MTTQRPGGESDRGAGGGEVGPQRRPWRLEAGTVAAGLGLGLAVGVSGSPGWQFTRVSLVAVLTGGLVLVERRAPERWRGRVAAAVGVVAVAVGAGLGPHLAKSGPWASQVAAALLLVAGLVLVIGGAGVVVRGRRRARKVTTGVGVALVAFLVALVVGPAVAATNVPRPELGATPADVGLDVEPLMVPTTDGARLAAWYVPSRAGAAVVLLHGAGSTRSNILDEAAVLADAGFGVLLVDARGHGGSGGHAMDFGWYGEWDVAAAVEVLAAQPDVDPGRIGVVGLSMGGEQALGASGAEPRIRAVVAEGATARSAADEAWLSEEFGLRGWLQEQLEWVQDRVTDLLTDAPFPTSSRAAVESSGETRYLLITAGEVPDEAYSAEHVAAAAPDRVEVWTVPGAPHVGGLATAPEEWADRVITFLNDSLGAPGAGRPPAG